MDAHTRSNRASCSSSATDAIAALPSPWRGIASTSATSPQQASMTLRTVDRLPPLRTPSVSLSFERRTPRAPVPCSPESFMPSTSAASMSSSLGYSCSARSYRREIGRNTPRATWCAWSTNSLNLAGTSRLIVTVLLRSSRKRSSPCSLRSSLVPRCDARSYQHPAFEHRDRAQIAIPAFDRVLLDVAVSAEQLH